MRLCEKNIWHLIRTPRKFENYLYKPRKYFQTIGQSLYINSLFESLQTLFRSEHLRIRLFYENLLRFRFEVWIGDFRGISGGKISVDSDRLINERWASKVFTFMTQRDKSSVTHHQLKIRTDSAVHGSLGSLYAPYYS